MNGICPILNRHYGSISVDDSNSAWIAIKVDRAGCVIRLEEGFATEADAEAFAGQVHELDLAEHWQKHPIDHAIAQCDNILTRIDAIQRDMREACQKTQAALQDAITKLSATS